MKVLRREQRGAGEEAGTPADESAPRHGGRRPGDSARRYSVEEKLALVDEFVRGEETFDVSSQVRFNRIAK